MTASVVGSARISGIHVQVSQLMNVPAVCAGGQTMQFTLDGDLALAAKLGKGDLTSRAETIVEIGNSNLLVDIAATIAIFLTVQWIRIESGGGGGEETGKLHFSRVFKTSDDENEMKSLRLYTHGKSGDGALRPTSGK